VPYKFLLACTFIALLCFSCSERERSSVFDPQSSADKLNIGLTVTSRDSSIILFWNTPRSLDYESFNIYRKAPGENNFSLYRQLPRGTQRFEETASFSDDPYLYYLRLQGNELESLPTDTLSIIPGPGDIWLLDWREWEVVNVSYDLSSIGLRHSTAWRPENMAFADTVGLVTHPLIGYFEIFSLENADILSGNNELEQPYDALFEPQSKLFWVSDSSGALYAVNPEDGEESLIADGLQRPTDMAMLDAQHIYVLERASGNIAVFNNSRQKTDTILLGFENPVRMRLNKTSGLLYVLNRTERDSLFRVDPQQGTKELFYTADFISAFAADTDDESIWIAITSTVNSEIVQLSASGIRLNSVDGFIQPTDLRVNPYNGHLLVADPDDRMIYHYRRNLQLLGSSSTKGAIVKLYIE